MKTQNEMRSEFEKLGNVKPVISACTFDETIDEYRSSKLPEYSLGFVNGAWYAFQEQQKKIDICEALRNEQFNKLWGIMQLIDDHDNNEKPASFYIKKIKEILK